LVEIKSVKMTVLSGWVWTGETTSHQYISDELPSIGISTSKIVWSLVLLYHSISFHDNLTV
jgi:hypothetical protein